MKLAIIDIGSNSVRLLLATYENNIWHYEPKQLWTTRLGQRNADGTLRTESMESSYQAFKDIKKCEIGWYNQTFRIHSFGSEVAHPIYFKINEQMVIKTDLTSNNEHIIELANLLKSHVKNFKDPYHLVLAMNDRSITVYEYIERIIHNKIIKPNLYK